MGRPYFGDNEGLDQVGNVPNIRKLAGCYDLVQNLRKIISLNNLNGLRLPPGFTLEDLELPGPRFDSTLASPSPLLPMDPASSVNSGVTIGFRTDSGVGDSLESNQLGIPFPTHNAGFHFDSFGDDVSSELAILDEEDEDDLDEAVIDHDDDDAKDEIGDSARPLPSKREFRKYARKKRLGVQFLSTLNAQQIATMSPTLKSSMDNFMYHVERHVAVSRIYIFMKFSSQFKRFSL